MARLPACSLGKSLSLLAVAGYVRCASPFRDVRNASRESSAVSRPRKVNCKVADHPRDLFRIPLLFLGIVSHSFDSFLQFLESLFPRRRPHSANYS